MLAILLIRQPSQTKVSCLCMALKTFYLELMHPLLLTPNLYLFVQETWLAMDESIDILWEKAFTAK